MDSLKRRLPAVRSLSDLYKCLATIFLTYSDRKIEGCPMLFIVFDGFSAIFKIPMVFVNLGSRHGRFPINLRLPSHQMTPINSPSNLSDQPRFGFAISHSNKLRFASLLHTNRNLFNPLSFSFTRDSAGQIFFTHLPVAGCYFLKKK
ncbi:hypothetical protein TNCV_1597551 [Trichonephila clavipes]|nr:hypothetical protein TNCV_1597551 [Trichonephila clavipes]